ncbi:MAG: MBOAT family protein, partial [Lachnospiraceae bacterium]|nr:MBOAT family protein [Lachnospiraceae bacterium]
MLFNSFGFLVFFPIVVCVYFLIPQKVRYLWLLGASYYFYMCWNAGYALLLLFVTAVTYLGALAIERFPKRKLFLVLTVCMNLSVLFAFKYFDFALSNLNGILTKLSVSPIEPEFSILLPVGISFYTFQALGYTMDVYRKEIPAEKNFLKYALFVSFFPQLVAGPIERSKNLLFQLNKEQHFDHMRMRKGLLIMLWGYFLKLVVADRAAIFVNAVYGDTVSYGGVYLIAATLLFAVQIYCDFAGYSTIARGAALIMGFLLTENFEAPYFAKSVTEFWRRWHISLSGWFRDYLYIPLGGNRKGTFVKYRNLLLVFLASGLWHGAAWNYVIWGGLNGIYQVAEGCMRDRKAKKKDNDVGAESSGLEGRYIKRMISVFITFVLIDFSWLFFRSDGISGAVENIKSILSVRNFSILTNGEIFTLGLNVYHFLFLLAAILLLWMADFFRYRNVDIFTWIEGKGVVVRYGIYLCLFCLVVL